jgi:DNA-binding response OmpR family regulator
MTGKSILFVEDDRDIRTLLADFLVREGLPSRSPRTASGSTARLPG